MWRTNTLSVLLKEEVSQQSYISGKKQVSHVDNDNALLIVVNCEIKLDHYVFNFKSGWKVSEWLKYPTIQLTASVDNQTHSYMN